MADNDKKDVFISYSTQKYGEETQYFCNLLEGSGIPCWMAPRDIPPGSNWAAGIVNGIENCELLVLMVTEGSVASQEVEKEIDLANSLKKKILQVRLENAHLSKALRYHLSNKQWINALEGAKETRFAGALTEIRNLLDKKDVDVVSDDSLLGQARSLVMQLNRIHATPLSTMNAMFSLQEEGSEKFKIFFPLRFGANGLYLIFAFDGSRPQSNNKTTATSDNPPIATMEFYVDGMSDADPLRTPFLEKFIKPKFNGILPSSKSTPRGRRWKCITLIPEISIPSPLIRPIDAFSLFKAHLLALSDQVFPQLFDWTTYAISVIKAAHKLQDKLKDLFPESEGWRVGAPEGERLDGLRGLGKINVFKAAWQPSLDNFRERGWLSITLESESPFLKDLYIGVLSYEPWLELGGWKDKIFTACKEKFADVEVKSEAGWLCWFFLKKPWNDSGISTVQNEWSGENDPEKFVAYCLEQFSRMKDLQELIDQACKALPALQEKGPSTFLPEEQNSWGTAHFYVSNRMRVIASHLKQAEGFDVECRYRGGGNWNEILLIVKEDAFDSAISFMFWSQEVRIAVTDLQPPHYETEVLNRFLANHSLNTLRNDTLKVEKECNNESVAQWMDRVQDFVCEHARALSSGLKNFREHLQAVIALTEQTVSALTERLDPSKGWKVENGAKSLESGAPINIYNIAWLREGAQSDEQPPLLLQILPESPCFDNLHLVVKLLAEISAESDRQLGAVCGACEFAFGTGNANGSLGLWSKGLDESSGKTGGSCADRPLLAGEEKEYFLSAMRCLADSIVKMEPILNRFCREHHEQAIKGELDRFVNDMANVLRPIFPAEEGWEMLTAVQYKEPHGKIRFFKRHWIDKENPQLGGALSLAIGGEDINFNNFYFGIAKAYPSLAIPEEELKEELQTTLGKKLSDRWFPWWCRAETDNRYWLTEQHLSIADEKRAALLQYYVDEFTKLKAAASVIDSFYPDPKQKGNEQEPCKKTIEQVL
ncbi:MAG: toll/interleukin-1 receptor domain-containing protein [Syntrophales bacterium]